MRLMLCLLAASLSLSAARFREHTDVTPSAVVRAIEHTYFAQTRKSPDNERRIKRLQIRNQTGLDGNVRGIHLDQDEDKPGIRAYGLPKKRLQDNGVIERVRVGDERIDRDTLRNGRLVEAYGMPKEHVESNGFIERLPISTVPPAMLRNEELRHIRSVYEGPESKIDEKVASEAEDMQAQESYVFRPLFVYRQQVAAREKRKHARKLAHENHRHARHRQSYNYRRERY